MDKWSYSELREFIHEDVEEFMADGLDIRKSSSRVQVEYADSIENSELEKLIIYTVLCEEGVRHGFLRNDIKEQTLDLLDSINLEKCDAQLDDNEQILLREDIKKVENLLSSDKPEL